MTIPQTGAPDAIISTVTGGVPTLTGTWTSARTWTFPDRSDTFAGLSAQTFTGAQTINLAGVNPSIAWTRGNTPALSLISLPGAVTGLYVESYGQNNGGQSGFACGGTATSPTATTSGLISAQIRAWGWDGTGTTQQNAGRIYWSATELWSATAHGSMPSLQGIGLGTTGALNVLTFEATSGFAAVIGITAGGATYTAGNGLLQFSSGTTKANGIAFGTDTFLYRDAANSIKTDGDIKQVGGQYFYLRGDSTTDGSCRISSPASGNVTIEIRVSGSWVEKQRWA